MCDFCKTFDFSSASWEVTKYGSHIKMAGGSYRYPIKVSPQFIDALDLELQQEKFGGVYRYRR